MHIPGGVISNLLCPVTLSAGAAVIGSSIYMAKKAKKPVPDRFAITTAIIFAAQMINYPITEGISAHLIGGVLAAFLLGTAPAVLSLSLIIFIQSIFFNDGGLLEIGANITTMAGVSAGIGGYLFSKIKKVNNYKYPLIFLITAGSVLAAAALCGIFVSIGKENQNFMISLMMKAHATPALIEVAITTAITYAVEKKLFKEKQAIIFLMAIAAALPFSSEFPDGLTYILKMSGIESGAPIIHAPMPEYSIPFIKNHLISLYLAAGAGIAGIFAVSKSGFSLLQGR